MSRQLVLALLPLLLTSCGGVRPVGVRGAVTLDGKPLPRGVLEFQPVGEGQVRMATIENGEFDLPPEQGLLPGLEFKVAIKAFRKTGRKYPNLDMAASYDEEVQYIPEQYNALSTLRVTISKREQDNQFRFDLQSTNR
jgi:hypothetical protein